MSQPLSDFIFGGVEGGATHSVVVLYRGDGTKLAECSGPSTNHWLDGMEECQRRIHDMVQKAKQQAGLDPNMQLKGLGLSLSGCEEESTNNALKQGFSEKYPNFTEHIFVASDTVASIATARENGGIVIIAGTGSNSLLLNPDGSVHRCGGWGHMLGDEGAAWWVSQKAIKVIIDEDDNFSDIPNNYSTKELRRIVFGHFEIKDRFGLLEHCYMKFQKSYFAKLCCKIAEGADSGDELCKWLLCEAGRYLGRHVAALIPNIHPSLLEADGGLAIVCVGSVWKSFHFMKEGFIKGLEPRHKSDNRLQEFTLLSLKVNVGTGAIYLAAKTANFNLPRDYSNNVSVLYHHKSGTNNTVKNTTLKNGLHHSPVNGINGKNGYKC